MPTRYRVEANLLLFALVMVLGFAIPITLVAGCDVEPHVYDRNCTGYPTWLSSIAVNLLNIAVASTFMLGLPLFVYVVGVFAAFFALKKRWIDDKTQGNDG